MIKKLYTHLKNGGVEVYLPAKKTGRCEAPYAVVNEEKSELTQSGKGLRVYYSVTAIAPLDSYDALDYTGKKIKAALKNTGFRFVSSEAAESGGAANGYKRIYTYCAIKPAYCKKK